MTATPDRTALYRIRGEDGVLLYIGITNQAVQPWWDELRSLTVEGYGTRTEAEDAEEAAILAEQPKYNVTYIKPTRLGRERKPLEVAPVESGRVTLESRADDEDLLIWAEVAAMTRMGPEQARKALARTGGPAGFTLGNHTVFRRREIRQWIADVEASQRKPAA